MGDTGHIYLLNLASHEVVQVTDSPRPDGGVAWAPGGHRLVFWRFLDNEPLRSAIFTVRPDGSDLRRLTTWRHFDTDPAYSPNGRLIVFVSDRGTTPGAIDLWVMGRNGGNLHRLRHLRSASFAPDWQPVT